MITKRTGLLLVISGPAGAGKGTLSDLLLKRDGGFCFSVSSTTRGPRPNEIAGVHYEYLTEAEFAQREENGDFLETATVHGHRYGTPLKPVMQMLDEGRDLLLDIDSQGALSVMNRLQNCVSVFILPPSFQELEKRLRARNTENEEDLQRRLRNARQEVMQLHHYNYALINDSLEEAYHCLVAIVTAERQNTKRFQPRLDD